MKVCRRQWITALSESFLPVVTFNQSNLKASVERILKTCQETKKIGERYLGGHR